MTKRQRECPFTQILAETEDNLVTELGELLRRSANRALLCKNYFSIGLSGGSLVQLLAKTLTTSPPFDTSRWLFFFCDERYVASDHHDSTYWAYKTQLLSRIPSLKESQFVKANTQNSLDDCAADYERQVKAKLDSNLPQFDLLLLGMGPDGHTCSLFPEQPSTYNEVSTDLVIPIRNSPKPPPERITFTLTLINQAHHVAFVVTGAGKAQMVKQVFVNLDRQFPAAWVEPINGELTLITDAAAGQELR